MFDRFRNDEQGAITADWAVLSATVVGLGIGGVALMGMGSGDLAGNTRDTLSGVTLASERDRQGETSGWNDNPDFVLPERRLPINPDHPELWAIPFHVSALPEGFPDLGGQDFTIIGDGNPRLLVAGADPRVVPGADNPQFNSANYADSGTAFGSGGFHRILIDTPPEGTTHRVQIHAGGQTFEYSFTNRPY